MEKLSRGIPRIVQVARRLKRLDVQQAEHYRREEKYRVGGFPKAFLNIVIKALTES